MARLIPIVLVLVCCTTVTLAGPMVTIDFEDSSIPPDISSGYTFFNVGGTGVNITFGSQLGFGSITLDNVSSVLDPLGPLAAEYGNRSLSPFGDASQPWSLEISIDYSGSTLVGESIVNVSWVMGDVIPSDEDGYRLGVATDPAINPGFGSPPAEFFVLDPLTMQTDAFGLFGSFGGAVNVEYGGISMISIRAGSAAPGFLDQLHSMYYDNFVFTFAAAPSGSDSPISGFGGDGDGSNIPAVSDPAGGSGQVGGTPPPIPEPGTMLLFCAGIMAFAVRRFRKRKS